MSELSTAQRLAAYRRELMDAGFEAAPAFELVRLAAKELSEFVLESDLHGDIGGGRKARRITPELLAKVAATYSDNFDKNPAQAVQRVFGVGPRMAGVYIQRARKAGLLPPTTPGRKLA